MCHGHYPRHELGVVAAVEEDHAVQFVASDHGPAPALRRVHLVVAVPGPLDGWLAVPYGRLAVHVPVDEAEVELAAAQGVELEVALFLLVDEVLVPGAHRDDAPAPREGGLRTGFDFAIVVLRLAQVIRQVPSSIQPVAARWFLRDS